MNWRTDPTCAPKPIVIALPEAGVARLVNSWPRTSVNEIVDALKPIVFRFARLFPTTFRPWLFVARPDNAVEKVLNPISFKSPYFPSKGVAAVVVDGVDMVCNIDRMLMSS